MRTIKKNDMKHKIVINNCYGGFGLSEAAEQWLAARGVNGWDLERHDPLLVECVETLGSEAASSTFAQLEVESIEGDLYRIEEYDGLETVITPSEFLWTKI